MKRLPLMLGAGLLVVLAVTAPLSAARVGAMIDLGTLGGSSSQPTVINERGQILGQSMTASGMIVPFIWEDGAMRELHLPGEFGTRPVDMNRHGQIVGNATRNYLGEIHGYLWEDGVATDLGHLGGRITIPQAINNRGQIVGVSYVPDPPTPGLPGGVGGAAHAFLWEDGVMTDLGTFGGFSSWADDINDRGQIVGYYNSDTIRAFLWEAGRMTEIVGPAGAGPGTVTTMATALNNAGHVVGITISATQLPRPFLWKDGHTTDLGTPAGGTSSAVDINNHDQIVGWMTEGPVWGPVAPLKPFLWEDGRITELGTLGGISAQPVDINDHGEITGHSQTSTGDTHAFLWSRRNH